jgi:hypothetical protein
LQLAEAAEQDLQEPVAVPLPEVMEGLRQVVPEHLLIQVVTEVQEMTLQAPPDQVVAVRVQAEPDRTQLPVAQAQVVVPVPEGQELMLEGQVDIIHFVRPQLIVPELPELHLAEVVAEIIAGP